MELAGLHDEVRWVAHHQAERPGEQLRAIDAQSTAVTGWSRLDTEPGRRQSRKAPPAINTSPPARSRMGPKALHLPPQVRQGTLVTERQTSSPGWHPSPIRTPGRYARRLREAAALRRTAKARVLHGFGHRLAGRAGRIQPRSELTQRIGIQVCDIHTPSFAAMGLRTRGHATRLTSLRLYHDKSRRGIRPVGRQVLRLTGVADFLGLQTVSAGAPRTGQS